MDSPIKWHGGKSYLSARIRGLFPEHTHYVEPYAGGLSVLLSGTGDGVSEVVNDIYGHLYSFWLTLAIPDYFERFVRRVQATPFSEELFRACQMNLAQWPEEPCAITDVDVAYSFFVVCRQSRQGLMKDFATLSRNRTRRGMNEQASAWLTAVEGLRDIHERLSRVVVLNRPALGVIRQQDGSNTLFYLDPPYLHETRVTTGDYKHEMSEQDHANLLVLLGGADVAWALSGIPEVDCRPEPWWENAVPIHGKFILSGYPSEMYLRASEAAGWKTRDFELPNNASGKKQKELKIERVWMNFDPPPM